MLKYPSKILKHPTKLNLPPGTMVYTGHYKMQAFEYELITYSKEGLSEERGSEVDFGKLRPVNEVKWLNVIGLADVDKIRALGNFFSINAMVLEDIVHVEQRTKLEIYDDFAFGVFKMIYEANQSGKDEVNYLHEHLSILLLPSMVITFQETPGDVFDSLRDRLRQSSGRIRSLGSDYLFFALIDAVVDHQMGAMSSIQNAVDYYERLIVDEHLTEIEKLHHVRKVLLTLKSAVLPEQEVMIKIQSEKSSGLITDHVKDYFKDVEDHIVHLSDRIMMYREMVTGLFEMHHTQTSNRMNDIMMTLTIFSVIFIPLSFLAGFFGMNFLVFPGLASPNGLIYFSIACVIIAIGMLGFFKWRKWL